MRNKPMSETFTFWLGMVAAGRGNGFCICGAALDNRNRQFDIHCHDGRSLRRVCDPCSARFAPTLARIAGVDDQVRLTDLIGRQDEPRWELSPVVECEYAEVETAEVDEHWFDGAELDIDDDAEPGMVAASMPTDPLPPTWARTAVIDPEAACETGACGPVL
jgi:hypothetical protein